jgi:hypothetical protein
MSNNSVTSIQSKDVERSKFLIPGDYSDTEAAMKVHIVCNQERSPNCLPLTRHQMGDRGRAIVML